VIAQETRWLVGLVAIAVVVGIWLGATIFRTLT
jgi:hypothetical protein